MNSPNLQQRILEVFRKFGEPCTRAEARDMLGEPDITAAEFGSRLSNLTKYGHVDAITGKDGIVRYVFAGDKSRKGRKFKRTAPEEATPKPAKAARAEAPAAEQPAKRKYTRKAKALAVVYDTTDSGSATDVAADSFSTSTLKLTADQARELAVITLSHPRPLSERMRKTVIDLVRIAA